jgi:hypothetical protein
MIFRNPQFLFLLILLPAIALLWRWRGRRVGLATLSLRLLTVGLIILALANPVIGSAAPAQGALVVLLDQSDSLGDAGKAALRAQAQRLIAEHAGPSSVVAFGANAVAAAPGEATPPDGQIRATQTDIAGALRLARGLVGAGGRIALLSDGGQTRGDALAEARALGVPVDTLAYAEAERPEVWIDSVDAPQTLRADEEYSVTVIVGSSEPGSARLELRANGQELASQQVPLEPGQNRFNFPTRAGQPGLALIEARVAADLDTFAQNNVGGATALVATQPRVLLIESRPGSAARLRAALGRSGVLEEVVGL